MPERKVIARTLDLELTGQQVKTLKHHYAGVVKHLEQKLPLNPDVLDNLQKELTGIVNRQSEWKKILDDIYHSGNYYSLLLRHWDNEILNLPWNMARYKNSDKPLGNLRQLYLCKGISDYFKEKTGFTTSAAPLKVLVMISAPDDGEFSEWFSYEDEEFSILQALSPLMESGQVEVDFCEDGSLEILEKRLMDCRYHILHFSGHGIFKKEKKKGYLVFEDAITMKKQLVGDRDFADVVNCSPDYLVPMVVLSSCQTAMGGSEETLRGVTNHLLRIGVPAVVSMGMSIIDTYAAYFTARLYEWIARKQNVVTAFHRAIEALQKKEHRDKINKNESPEESLQWIIPNLYLSQPVEQIVDWKAPEQKPVLMSNRYILEKDRLLLPHEKEYIFLDRRREKSEILGPLFRKTPILLKGQGGVGKTAMAEHLVHRLIAADPRIIPFAFNEKNKSIGDILERLKDYLRDQGQVEAITKLIYYEKGLDKFIFLVFEINKIREPVFIFDNLESFQQAPGEEFCDQHMDLKEIIAYLCRCQQFPVILTGRYPVPGLLNLLSFDLNQVGLTDFWKKSLYLQMGGIRAYLKEEEERLLLDGAPYRRPLVFFDILQLLHGTFGGNFRALELFNRLLVENTRKIGGALVSLASFREQSAEMAAEVRSHMGENLLFSRLMDLLGEKSGEVLDLLSGFRVPVTLKALEAQLKEQKKEWEKLASDLEGLESMLVHMQQLTLIEMSIRPGIDEIFYYVTPIVRDLLAAYKKDKESPGLVFNHQKAGDYFYDSYHDRDGSHTLLEEAFFHYDLAGTNPDRLQEIGDILSGLYYNNSMYNNALFYAQRVYEVLGDRVSAATLNCLGVIYCLNGDNKRALPFFQKALSISRRKKDKEGEGLVLNNIYEVYFAQGDYETALECLGKSLKIHQEIGHKAEEGGTLNNISMIYQARGDYNKALDYLKKSLEITRASGNKLGEAAALNNISQVYEKWGENKTALKYLEQSLAIKKQIGDKLGEGATLNNISLIYKIQGNYNTALKYLEQSLRIHRQIGDKSGEAARLNNIGLIYDARGDYDIALKYLEKNLEICRQIGKKSGEGTALNNIGQIYSVRCDYETALTYLGKSTDIRHQLGDRPGEATTLNNISLIYEARGDYDRALECREKSLIIHREIGERSGEATALNNISLIHQARSDYDKALMYMEQSLEIQKHIGNKSKEGTALNNIAAIYINKGDHEKAPEYLRKSLEISRRIGNKPGEGTVLNNFGLVYAAREDYDNALMYLGQSLELQKEAGDRAEEATSLNNIGLVYQKRGEHSIALKYLEQSLEIRQRIGSSNVGADLNNIGMIYEARGDYSKAMECLDKSLEINRKLGNKAGEGATLNNIGQVYKSAGDYTKALEYLGKSLEITEELGDEGFSHLLLHNMAAIVIQKGNFDKYLEYETKAYNIAIRIKNIKGIYNVGISLGYSLCRIGETEEGMAMLEKSLEIGKKAGFPDVEKIEDMLNEVRGEK